MKIFTILFPVFILILIGYLYGRKYKPDMEASGKLVLQIFVPALVFDALSSSEFKLFSYQWLLIGGVVVILGSGLISWMVSRYVLRNWQIPNSAFLPTMMFNNCGNLGLPLSMFAFGQAGLDAAIVLFLISNLLHFTVGIYLFGGVVSWKGLISTPVNIATALGLLVNYMEINLPEVILQPIAMLGQIVIPLMLFSLGVRMVNVEFKHWKVGVLGAIICPLSGIVCALLISRILPLDLLQFSALVVFSALPPAVLNFLFAEQYRQQPELVASMVLIGNALAVFVLSLVFAWLV